MVWFATRMNCLAWPGSKEFMNFIHGKMLINAFKSNVTRLQHYNASIALTTIINWSCKRGIQTVREIFNPVNYESTECPLAL